MSTQIAESTCISGNRYLRVSNNQAPILDLIYDLLNERSPLKKGVIHDSPTVIAGANALLGAMATNGSLEIMGQIYIILCEVFSQQ